MKSIKEKSEEYLQQEKDEILSVYDRYAGFVDGANYVLDIIEQLVYEKHVKGNLPLFDLTHLIDKLKEK